MGLEESETILELEGVLAGDRGKVRAFVDRVTPVIQARVARLLLKHYRAAANDRIREEVADLSQEVFVALFAEKGRVLRGWCEGVQTVYEQTRNIGRDVCCKLEM